MLLLETNPQPGGILIESWYLSDNPSIDRAAASTFWDKKFVVETINKCHKYLLLVGLEICQNHMLHLPLKSVINLGSIKLFLSPPNGHFCLYHQSQNSLWNFQVRNQTNAFVLFFDIDAARLGRRCLIRWLGRTWSLKPKIPINKILCMPFITGISKE